MSSPKSISRATGRKPSFSPGQSIRLASRDPAEILDVLPNGKLRVITVDGSTPVLSGRSVRRGRVEALSSEQAHRLWSGRPSRIAASAASIAGPAAVLSEPLLCAICGLHISRDSAGNVSSIRLPQTAGRRMAVDGPLRRR